MNAKLPLHSSNSTNRWQLLRGLLCLLLMSVLLVELCSQQRLDTRRPTVIMYFITNRLWINRSIVSAHDYPQGPDVQLWPRHAQMFIKRLEAALARYFPSGMPPADDSELSNKQKYIRTHLPRFAHTLIRASPHIKPGAKIVALGEKGHVPALLHELFKPSMLKVTTMEFPGTLVLHDTATNSSIEVEQVQHNAETEPLPFVSESIDHIFFLEVLEHLMKDPFYAILEMHRVLKPNGTLFISTPNLGSFTSLGRLHDGWSPYSYSKYLSNKDGEGYITHTREYTWKELERYMEVAGFEPELRCFSTYKGDKDFWDFEARRPKPQYQQLLASLPAEQQSLDMLGSTSFIIATKARVPDERRPWQLYAYATEFEFDGYPVCRSKEHGKLCSTEGSAEETGSSGTGSSSGSSSRVNNSN